jgi:hypothetical protein
VRHRVPIAVCALAAAALPGGPAIAASPALPPPASPALWATIDVCDSAARPDTIGVRGSMPGDGDRAESMFMQFRLEYLRQDVWTNVGAGAESGFEPVGSASARSRQAGVDFRVAPRATRHYLLRGVVTYQWRLGDRVVATTLRSTSAGRSAGAGANPPGYSAAVCSIAPKRRGSFVITPVTPSAASRAISRRSSTVQG